MQSQWIGPPKWILIWNKTVAEGALEFLSIFYPLLCAVKLCMCMGSITVRKNENKKDSEEEIAISHELEKSGYSKVILKYFHKMF